MSVIGNYLNGMSQVRGIQNHGSVEDLIRSTLGNRFTDNPIKKEPGSQHIAHVESVNQEQQNVNEFLQVRQNLDPDANSSQRKLTPFQKSLLTSRDGHFDSTPKNQTKKEIISKSEEDFADKDEYYQEPEFITEPIRRSNEYLFHRDADEIFECKVTVEGGSSDNTTARLVLKTDVWNVFFDGSVKKNGTCIIPLKKLSLFPEGTIGHAYLEIVVDDVVFIPWESPFRISMSKKVSVQTPSLNRR